MILWADAANCHKGSTSWLGWKGDPPRIVQEIKIWPSYQILYAQTRSDLENETHKILWDFKIQTDHQILARWPDLFVKKKQKKKKQQKNKNKELV